MRPGTAEGRFAGISARHGDSGNEGEVLSPAVIDAAHAEAAEELVVTWGEPHGKGRKPRLERHEQRTVRATVAPVPYAATARPLKRDTVRVK